MSKNINIVWMKTVSKLGRTALTEELVREVEAEKLEAASLQQALQKAKNEAWKLDFKSNYVIM